MARIDVEKPLGPSTGANALAYVTLAACSRRIASCTESDTPVLPLRLTSHRPRVQKGNCMSAEDFHLAQEGHTPQDDMAAEDTAWTQCFANLASGLAPKRYRCNGCTTACWQFTRGKYCRQCADAQNDRNPARVIQLA
jgi:hypothetical protein